MLKTIKSNVEAEARRRSSIGTAAADVDAAVGGSTAAHGAVSAATGEGTVTGEATTQDVQTHGGAATS